MTHDSHWAVLGLEPSADAKIIRKQYAILLKAIDQRADPDKFQTLRQAYEWALNAAAWMAHEQAQQEQAPKERLSDQQIQELSAPPAADASLIDIHLSQWAADIGMMLNRGDAVMAAETLSQQLKSAVCTRRETWQQYQELIINLCLQGEQIPFAFVLSAAEQFGWFNLDQQLESFNKERVRAIRSSIIRQDAMEVISELKKQFQDKHTAADATLLHHKLAQERLQGLNERDFFEVNILTQSTQMELPLEALQMLNDILRWKTENGHLWALAPQACEQFRERMLLLNKQQDAQNFEAHLHRIAENLPDDPTADHTKQKKWPYVAVPASFSIAMTMLVTQPIDVTKGMTEFLSIFFLLFSLVATLSLIRFKRNRVLHHPIIETHAVRNLLSSYRPIWLRWRALRADRQQRTKDWLTEIDSRHISFRDKLDPKTVAFWRHPQPSITPNRFFIYLTISSPLAAILSALIADWVGDVYGGEYVMLLTFPVLSSVQIYLFAALPIWCDPTLQKINRWLLQWIVPKRFIDLPERGLSGLITLLLPLFVALIATVLSLGFELRLHQGSWISWFIIFPTSTVILWWSYLWLFEYNPANQKPSQKAPAIAPSNTKSSFEFQWWHWILIFLILRAIAHIH